MADNVLNEADRLTSTDRQSDYGHPAENFEQTAALWHAAFGWQVTAHQVAYAMMLVKLSRQTHKPKRDNLIDMCGYARTAEMVDEYYDERDQREVAVKAIEESIAERGV